MLPALETTGLFTTTFNQYGSYTFNLPTQAGTLALLSDVAASTTAASAALGIETTRAETSELANATAIGAEITRAETAETANANAIAAETTNRISGDANQATQLAAETAARIADYNATVAALASETASREGDYNATVAALASETASREGDYNATAANITALFAAIAFNGVGSQFFVSFGQFSLQGGYNVTSGTAGQVGVGVIGWPNGDVSAVHAFVATAISTSNGGVTIEFETSNTGSFTVYASRPTGAGGQLATQIAFYWLAITQP
jgi:hypothetical protein